MCVSLLSRDDKDLVSSRSILVTAIGDCSNSGIEWDGLQLIDQGHAPILIDPFQGEISFKNDAKKCDAYVLNDKGERIEKLAVTSCDGGFKVTFAYEQTAMYFELALAD